MNIHIGVAAILVTSGILTSAPVPAQRAETSAPRTHEIFLAAFRDGEGRTKLDKPVNITHHDGDDDRPCFLPDSSGVLFASDRDSKQRDIYRYDITTKTVTRVTNSPEDEHSPMMMSDGRTFSAVRGADQQLWRLNLDGSDAGSAPMHLGPIRDYVWVSPAKIAQWVPDAQGSGTVSLVDLESGTSEIMISNVGPSLLVPPRSGALTFVFSPRAGTAQIKEIDLATRKIGTYAPTVDGGEALAWTPSGRLLMASGTKLFVREHETNRWIESADLTRAGVRAITRVTVSPDGQWIAIVATVGK